MSASVLVVDDNEDNRYTLTRRLAREGYTDVATAADGREALGLLRAKTFDIVLLDIMMPEMNGYEVLEQMKADARLRNVPVIMISALSEVESVVRCIELGAEDYLPKPFNPTLLRARLGASLEKKRLRDAVRASLARLEEEMSAAARLQMSMLPRSFPAWTPDRPVDVYAVMEPAREVGGDLYDFFYDGALRFCFLVGDVSGKGAAAAMFMARTRSLVRMAVELLGHNEVATPPSEVLQTVNRELCRDNDEHMFVTIFLGFLDIGSGALAYANAGHPPPHLLLPGAAHPFVSKPDIPLGVRSSAAYRDFTLQLEPGAGILVTSDGVPESMNEAGDLYSAERLTTDLQALSMSACDQLASRILENVHSFAGAAPKADDVAVLALRWRPA